MRRRAWWMGAGLVAMAVIIGWLAVGERAEPRSESRPSGGRLPASSPKVPGARGESAVGEVLAVSEAASEAEEEAEAPPTEEERLEAEAEQRVDAFDALTDRWMEPQEKAVTMAEIDAFRRAFARVPKARQDECIHRALNLIPDENIMLLAGVLLDSEQDREIVETVFNDILNRDESVKQPILQQVFKNREHPCWTDTAWILDVTDQLR